MRARALLLVILAVGCGSAEGIVNDPSDVAFDDTEVPADSAATDVAVDSVADADTGTIADAPKDVAKDVAAETTADVGTDAYATECDGFSSKALIPPTTCDKSGGLTSSQVPSNGLYSTSWFGCYLKSDGTIYKDPSDNCLFGCGNMGLCAAGKTGPQCEAELKWFSADADRYGCGTRIRVTNCKNGKHVVLATLDKGPGCSYEKSWGAPVLDMSYPAMTYLFDGKTYGGSELQRVHVMVVPSTTPLGPM